MAKSNKSLGELLDELLSRSDARCLTELGKAFNNAAKSVSKSRKPNDTENTTSQR